MNLKTFIKLGNKSFNLSKIDYLELDDNDLSINSNEIDLSKYEFYSFFLYYVFI